MPSTAGARAAERSSFATARHSTLPPAASIAAFAPAVASTPDSFTARSISPFLTIFTRLARASTRPASRNAARSMVSPLTEASRYSSTSWLSRAILERKPTFGRRRCSGIWPPSKPALTLPPPVRAYWPLWPRPAVLPRPEPMPRPTRTRSRRAPFAGFNVFNRMSSLLDAHEVIHGVDQTAHLRAVLQLAHVIGLVESERLDAQAMPALHAAQTADQPHLHGGGRVRILLSHCPAPPRSSCRAWPRCVPARPSTSDP